ncbi:TRAP transporter small permease subunit [Ornithinibacillus sp. L9]|uniref:TRAP transporter small permease subunit n=1 Tax=Ornithinibacillus caprae TaxID=2678566 RepID=A0A6N8FQX4_9BACI|nr:TRAP transporter small permease [Ornithinibacillus caprae]MUK90817.1 TRAP transporter small permease subunit [Ornithinibacillus caprae]
MSKVFERSEEVLDKIITIQQVIANVFLFFIMAIITFDVLGRNLFNQPLKGTYELTELGAALLVFFALAMTHRKGDHITIDFLLDRFSDKMKRIINGMVEIVVAIVVFFMARHIFENGVRMMERNSTTTDLALPVHPFLFIIAFTLVIFMFTAIVKAFTYLRLAVNEK